MTAFRQPTAADNSLDILPGWFSHDGKGRHIGDNMPVMVLLRSGTCLSLGAIEFSPLRSTEAKPDAWQWYGGPFDSMAYRFA